MCFLNWNSKCNGNASLLLRSLQRILPPPAIRSSAEHEDVNKNENKWKKGENMKKVKKMKTSEKSEENVKKEGTSAQKG